MRAMGVRLNGQTIGVVQVPEGASQREVMRRVYADCPVASAAKAMVLHARVGAFVVHLTVAEA